MSSKQNQKVLIACDPKALFRSQPAIEARKLIALLLAAEQVARLSLRADLVARLERGDSIRIDVASLMPIHPAERDMPADSDAVPFILMTHFPDFRQTMLTFRYWGWDDFGFGVFFFDESKQSADGRLFLAQVGYCVMNHSATRRLLDYPGAMQVPKELEAADRRLLDCLGRGLTNAEIARELALPITRVKTLVRALLSRLHLENRTCAAVLAYWMHVAEQREDKQSSDSEARPSGNSLNGTARGAYRRNGTWSCQQKGHANGVGGVLGG